jgi:sulfide dehydrogenase cytochrome subunit
MMKLMFSFASVAVLLLPLELLASGRSAEALSGPCNGCHGTDGISQGDAIPSIAGMNAEYMTEAMVQFKEGRRNATIMNRIAKGYKDYELRKIARYFSSIEWKTVPSIQQETLVARGRELHEQHCAECHEDSGRYQDKDMPRIAGQRHHYLQTQLLLYYQGEEKLPQPSEMAEKLAEIAKGDLPALSAFYSTLP